MEASALRRSPIRWAGSKKKLLPALLKLAPPSFGRYVEPFCGSLCLFVALQPSEALVGDINAELINFYETMQTNAAAIATMLHSLPNDAETYYALRKKDPSSLASVERATRFLYLNRFCFNGVYRTNKLGAFNVPRGKHMGSIPKTDELLAFGELLKRATPVNLDFESLVDKTQKDDFMYMDPPYAGRGTRDRGEYGVGTFKDSDIARLYDCTARASKKGVKIMLSYADIPQIRELYSEWNIEDIEVTRNVSGFTKGRTKVTEIIIRNYV